MLRKKRKRKTKVRFYSLKGLKCQGRKELRFVKECIRYNWVLPIKQERVETPYGFYTPDFEYEEMYIEIKSIHTFNVSRGLIGYKGLTQPSSLQWNKIKWVAINVKPIEIIIYLSRRESIPTEKIEEKNITIKYKGGYVKKEKR